MRRNSKWIIGAVLLLWYGLGAVSSAQPKPAQAEDASTFEESPQAVEGQIGLTPYPGSSLRGSTCGGGSSYTSASLSTTAPMTDVVHFYSTKYASRKPLYQRRTTPRGQSLLMFWQQPDATYLVMIKSGNPVRHRTKLGAWGGLKARTVYSLTRLSHPLKLVEGSPLPWERDKPLPVCKFGLPLPPASRVDYCGWARGERGMMGMALAEVNSKGAEVGAFYRDLVRSGSYGTSGNGGHVSWHGSGIGQYEVRYYQTDESLPTIVVLQHSGGRWWELLMPRLWN